MTGSVSSGSSGTNHRIDGKRLWDSLMEMAQIGATPKGGVRRLAAEHGAQLAERLLRGAQSARLVQLRPAQNAGLAFVRRGEQPRQPLLELGHERPCVAGSGESIELVDG